MNYSTFSTHSTHTTNLKFRGSLVSHVCICKYFLFALLKRVPRKHIVSYSVRCVAFFFAEREGSLSITGILEFYLNPEVEPFMKIFLNVSLFSRIRKSFAEIV